MASGTIEKILRLKDEASRPLLKMAIAAEKAASGVEDLDGAVAEIEKALSKLDTEADGAADALDDVADATHKMGKETKKAKDHSAALAGFMGGMGATAMNKAIEGATALARAYVGIGVSSVQVGAQMESFETQLTVLMGSAGTARKRLDELFKIGTTTPFELSSLVEAEVNLRALGVNAEESLPLIMDFAGAMNTDLASAAVEVGRAMMFGAGAVETIAGRSLRAQVKLRTGIDGLKMTTAEFRTALVDTLTDPQGIFAGGTQKLAATFKGMLSNLADAWFKFQKEIADAGLFLTAKATLDVILERLDQAQESTKLWAATASGTLTETFFALAEMSARIAQGFLILKGTFEGLNQIVLATRMTILDMLSSLQESLRQVVEIRAALGQVSPEEMQAVRDATIALNEKLFETRQELHESKQAGVQLMEGIQSLSGVTDVLDDIRDRAKALGNLKPKIDVSVDLDIDKDTQAAMAALGMPIPGIVSAPSGAKARPSGGGGGASKAQGVFEGLRRQMEGLIPKEALSDVEKMSQLLVDMRETMATTRKSSRRDWAGLIKEGETALLELRKKEISDIREGMRESLEGMGADIERASAQLEELGPTLLKTMDDARKAQREKVAGAITAGIQGIQDPTSLLAMAGPGGAAAGAGLGLLQTDPKEIEAKLGGLVDAAKNAGPTLRVILRDLIPAFIAEFPAALVTGLIDALPDIVEAFIIKLPIALAEALIKALKALWDSFVQFILRIIPGKQKGEKGKEAGVFRRAGASIGDLFRTKEGKAEARERRGFATGTAWVDRTGLAMVHQGEAILPASGTISQSVRGRAGGGGQVINVNVNGIMDSNVIDQLGRQLNRHFGTMGRSTLPIFGGG